MQLLITASLMLAGVVHLLPLMGVTSASGLTALYGIPFEESNLQILMRHRAILFGILGTMLLVSAFIPRFRAMAIPAGLLSAASFIWIALSVGGYNAMLHRVVQADIVALVALLVAAGVHIGLKPA